MRADDQYFGALVHQHRCIRIDDTCADIDGHLIGECRYHHHDPEWIARGCRRPRDGDGRHVQQVAEVGERTEAPVDAQRICLYSSDGRVFGGGRQK